MASKFNAVNAIEISLDTYNVLLNNIKVLKVHNVNAIHGDSMDILGTIEQDVIVVDAPWGGRDYKTNETMRLYMSNREIHELYIDYKHKAKLFVFKVPCNYDVEYFKEQVDSRVRVIDYIREDRTGKEICYYKFLCIYNE